MGIQLSRCLSSTSTCGGQFLGRIGNRETADPKRKVVEGDQETRLKRWLRVGLIVVAVIVGIVLLQTFVFRPKPIQVDVATVEKGDVEDAVSNSQAGTLKARHRSRLGAERAGRVVSIPHLEGESVARGAD